jgi:hypothetical protein
VVNSELQPTLGLRWLLCYEEHDRNVVHLQKAAPQHWFSPGEVIRVRDCPTRFGPISWTTHALTASDGAARWKVEATFVKPFDAALHVHIHPPDRTSLRSATLGEVHPTHIVVPSMLLAGKTRIEIDVG